MHAGVMFQSMGLDLCTEQQTLVTVLGPWCIYSHDSAFVAGWPLPVSYTYALHNLAQLLTHLAIKFIIHPADAH